VRSGLPVWTKKLVVGAFAAAALSLSGPTTGESHACSSELACSCDPAKGDGDCTTPPNLHCDATLGGGECVACVHDDQCSGGALCETEPNNPQHGKCVECTPIRDNNCSPTTAGDRCIGTTDTCGCITEVDCGGVRSGRVCDETSTRKCIEGCRGEGGNGCADDESCSSTNHDIGRCEPKSGRDGGGNDDDGGGNRDGGHGHIVAGGGCTCTTAVAGADPLLGKGIGLGLAVAALLGRRRRRRRRVSSRLRQEGGALRTLW
jgi:MYXO-CTERM domain-containing protein